MEVRVLNLKHMKAGEIKKREILEYPFDDVKVEVVSTISVNKKNGKILKVLHGNKVCILKVNFNFESKNLKFLLDSPKSNLED